jgi:tryptophan synthase alpha chain
MNPFKKDTKQLSIFITAGYPKINSLSEQLYLLQDHEVDFVEVGMPFSDPLADGLVIQQSSQQAIRNGMTLELLFKQLGEIKANIHIPLVLMGYFNPVLQYGVQRFLKEASQCGIKGVIIPDLPFEIYKRSYQKEFEKHSLSYIPLITPKSSDSLIKEAAEMSRNGFVYLVSQHATTGTDIQFRSSSKRYDEIRRLCGDTPLFIGFGIRTASDLQAASKQCDGGIIGSSFIKALQGGTEKEFLKSLKEEAIQLG